MLREKQEDLKANNAAAAEKIRALEERLTELAGSRRELEEAVSAERPCSGRRRPCTGP